MMISMISALAKNRAIGKLNGLPWYLPADLKHFKEKTSGKIIILGFNTFKSIGEKPLPNRKQIILSEYTEYQVPENCFVATSIDRALEIAKKLSEVPGQSDEIMICGGAMVYKQFLPLAERLYLTFIDHDFEGDIFFPEFNMEDWREVSREDHEPDEKNKYKYSFVVLERKR